MKIELTMEELEDCIQWEWIGTGHRSRQIYDWPATLVAINKLINEKRDKLILTG